MFRLVIFVPSSSYILLIIVIGFHSLYLLIIKKVNLLFLAFSKFYTITVVVTDVLTFFCLLNYCNFFVTLLLSSCFN